MPTELIPSDLDVVASDPGRFGFCTSLPFSGLEPLEPRLLLAAAPIGNAGPGNGWDASSAITVTASSAHPSGQRDPVNTVNGSGIDASGFLHDNNFSNMWLSGDLAASAANVNPGTVPGSHWIRYDFDQAYTLESMLVWNYNELNFPVFGLKDVTVEYSLTGGSNPAEWTTAFNGQIPIASAGGSASSTADAQIFFGNASVQSVVITADSGVGANHSNGTFPDVGLSEVRFLAQGLAGQGWQDAQLQQTLTSNTVEARFQAGNLYQLTNLATGQKLINLNPATLNAVLPIFGTTSVDLSQATVSQTLGPGSVSTTYTWTDGTAWQVDWSVDGDDIVLQTSAQTPSAVSLFSYFIDGADVVNHNVVAADVNGVSTASSGAFTGALLPQLGTSKTSNPQTAVQPLIALFEGSNQGFVVEGRDPQIGPSNLRPFGEGATAELMMVRTLEHQPTTTPSLYEIRLRAYQGDWEDGVQPYVDWMQNGLGFTPIDQKPQKWIQDIKTQVYIPPQDYTTLNAVAARLDPTKTYLGREASYRFFGFDIGYPDYSVDPGAATWIAQARTLGFHVGVHVNVGGIDRSNTALIQQMAPGLQQIGTDGSGNPIYDGTSTFVYVSAAYAPWRAHLVNAIAEVVSVGADVIYLDQTNGVLGKFFVNGMTGIEGVQTLMQEIKAAYPGVAIQTEQFNPMSSRYADFALTTLELGHPLSGFLFSRFIKIVPEGINYQPTDLGVLDSFTRWGSFTPGAGGVEAQESWLQIAEAFQQFNLTPDARLPLGPNQVSGFGGGFIPGGADFNGDLKIDPRDIDLLFANFGGNLKFDTNGDGTVNQLDVIEYVQNVLGTEFGDADLDGDVDLDDFNRLALNFNATGAGWAGGDFSGNGVTNASDQTLLSQNFGFTNPGFSLPTATLVTGFFEETATTRSFVVYEPGQAPQVFGERVTNVTQFTGTGGGIEDWVIYNGNTLKGLDPGTTYFLDPAIALDPNRFHLTNIPADYQGISNPLRVQVTQELGFFDRWFRITFAGNGTIDMVVPDNYDVYLDGQAVTIDRVNNSASVTVAATAGNPSEILAFLNSGPESVPAIQGLLADIPFHIAKHKATKSLFDTASSLFPDSFYNVVTGSGATFGELPVASSIRLQGSYLMRDANFMGVVGDGVILINGNEVARLNPGTGPPFPTLAFDVDITQYAGQDIFLELLSDGPFSLGTADWITPQIVVVGAAPATSPPVTASLASRSAASVQQSLSETDNLSTPSQTRVDARRPAARRSDRSSGPDLQSVDVLSGIRSLAIRFPSQIPPLWATDRDNPWTISSSQTSEPRHFTDRNTEDEPDDTPDAEHGPGRLPR
jgi:hypothetical protein